MTLSGDREMRQHFILWVNRGILEKGSAINHDQTDERNDHLCMYQQDKKYPKSSLENFISNVIVFFCLSNIEAEGFMNNTASSHQGGTQMFWETHDVHLYIQSMVKTQQMTTSEMFTLSQPQASYPYGSLCVCVCVCMHAKRVWL